MKTKNIIILFATIIISILTCELILRKIGLTKFVIYYPSNFYGYYHEPNQNLQSRFNKTIYLDKLGNRNPKENNIENSNLFFLGDSVTYGGSIVSNQETFASLIADKKQKKYLNISANGWGIPNIINFIDFHNLYKENSTYILTCINDCFTRNIRKIEQSFLFKKISKFALINLFKFALHKFNNINYSLAKSSTGVNKEFTRKDNIKTINYSVNRLKQFDDKLKSLNSNLIFVYSPNSDYIKKKFTNNPIFEDDTYRNIILKQITNSEIKFINIIEYFSEKELNNFGRFYIDKVHLSKEGHNLYVKILSNIIDE